MPDVVATLVEEPDPQAPLGAKGVGEPPCISVTPAIVAAIRDALRQADGETGARRRDIIRVPCAPPTSPGADVRSPTRRPDDTAVVRRKSWRNGHRRAVG